MALDGKYYHLISLWKMKELLFSGLADHQCLQVSRYQQEAIYYEESQVCNAIMELLDYQKVFYVSP